MEKFNKIIGFDIYDVYNNDYYLPLRPGKPAYEIDVQRGDNGYSNGGNYDEGTLDASTMVGFVITYDSNTVIADKQIEYMFEDRTINEDCEYPAGTSTISLTVFMGDEYSDDEFEFEFYYSADSMFSDRELQADVFSGTASCVEEDGAYYYRFDYTGSIESGYYIISVTQKGSSNRALISVTVVG